MIQSYTRITHKLEIACIVEKRTTFTNAILKFVLLIFIFF